MENAIKRRQGGAFLSLAAGFFTEHGWDFGKVVDGNKSMTFHTFEQKQIILAKERLAGVDHVKITRIPGGHMPTSEQVDRLVEIFKIEIESITYSSDEF